MFTGIIQSLAEVVQVSREPALMRLDLRLAPARLIGLVPGASVAVNGVCLTVVGIDADRVSFDVIAETLRVTTLGGLHAGQKVHIERSLRHGDEIGGHQVYGHVQTTGTVIAAQFEPGTAHLRLRVSAKYFPYLIAKGFVAVHGVSLTLCEPASSDQSFQVNLIPETLRRTIFDQCQVGERLNLEFDPYLIKKIDSLPSASD